MKKRLFFLFFLCFSFILNADVFLKEIKLPSGVKHILIKNEFFDVEFAPETGAAAISFKTRYSNRQWCYPKTGVVFGGLFKDNFVGQGYPGELPLARYDYQIIKNTQKEVVVKFQTLTKGGILVYKKIHFFSNSPFIKVDFGMENKTNTSIVKGLWPKFDIYISGEKEHNRYFRPDIHGINVSGWNEEKKYMGGVDFIKYPFAGWTAAINTKTGEGLVWLMDYNYLKWLYNCNSAWTIEWFYDSITLPKGKKWETTYYLILIKGFDNISHASKNIICGTKVEVKKKFEFFGKGTEQNPEFILITHSLSSSVNGDLKNIVMKCSVVDFETKNTHILPEVKIEKLTGKIKEIQQSIKLPPERAIVCKIKIEGEKSNREKFEEKYEYYWPGIKGEKFDLMAGETVTPYYRKPPRKIKKYFKPGKIVYYRKPEPKMIEFRGPFYEYWKIPQAAVKAGIKEIDGSYFISVSFAGNTLTYIPSTYNDFFKYDLIVLNNVDAECLTDFGLEVIKDFVKTGGSLIVLGGFYAFGPGGYSDTQLEEILPVKLSGKKFDFVKLNPPQKLKITKEAKVLSKYRLRKNLYCFWVQDTTPKKNALVEIKAGKVPFLVCGKYGKGKVAVITGNVCGTDGKRIKGFWETDEWEKIMERVIKWLVFE